ncbi:hypothetical protein JCM10207_003054 [Rhodosporidiobolus poonsookiae]
MTERPSTDEAKSQRLNLLPFPAELISEVLTDLRPCHLARCALACRALLPIARDRLYRTADLGVSVCEENGRHLKCRSSQRLLAALDMDDHGRAAFVRTLRIVIGEDNLDDLYEMYCREAEGDPHRGLDPQRWKRDEEDPCQERFRRFVQVDQEWIDSETFNAGSVVRRLSTRLPNLQHLFFIGVESEYGPSVSTAAFHLPNSPTPTFPSVTTLDVDILPPSPERAFPHLERLALNAWEPLRELVNSSPPPSPPSNLRKLILGGAGGKVRVRHRKWPRVDLRVFHWITSASLSTLTSLTIPFFAVGKGFTPPLSAFESLKDLTLNVHLVAPPRRSAAQSINVPVLPPSLSTLTLRQPEPNSNHGRSLPPTFLSSLAGLPQLEVASFNAVLFPDALAIPFLSSSAPPSLRKLRITHTVQEVAFELRDRKIWTAEAWDAVRAAGAERGVQLMARSKRSRR